MRRIIDSQVLYTTCLQMYYILMCYEGSKMSLKDWFADPKRNQEVLDRMFEVDPKFFCIYSTVCVTKTVEDCTYCLIKKRMNREMVQVEC